VWGFAAAALVVAALPLAAQEPALREAAAQELPVGERIASIDVIADWPGLLPTARAAIALVPGDQYDIERMRKSLQNLYGLGTIANVNVRASRRSEGIDLRFELEPMLHLWDVRFVGDRPWRKSRLRRALSLREGAVLDEAAAAAQAERLRDALADDGYVLASVTARVLARDNPARSILELDITPGTRSRLASLRVDTDGGIAGSELITAIDMPVGETYRPEDFEEGLGRIRDRLIRSNYFFHDIRVIEQSIDLRNASMNVVVDVLVGPRVELDLGDLPVDDNRLRERLAVFEFGTIADWALKDSRHEIVRWLQERGHWRPLVSYTRTRDDDGRNIAVDFRVLRGQRASLRRIDVEGNDAIPAGRLVSGIRSRPSAFLSPSRFISDWWEEDLRAMETVYRRSGFLDVTVSSPGPKYSETDDGVVVIARVEEGPRTLLRAVDVIVPDEAAAPISADLWTGNLELRAGGPFDRGAVRRDADTLRALLANAGYPRAFVASDVQRDDDGVSVVYEVFPGERQRVARVLISGNDATRASVIERELAFAPGSPLSFADLLETQSRLYSTGLFSQVDVAPALPDGLDEDQPLIVRVQEAPPLFITYGAGYDTEERVRGTFTIGHNNVRGRNQQLSFSTRASLREQRFRVLFTEPYFLGRRQEATATAFYTNEQKASFSTQRSGASGQLVFQHSDTTASLPRLFFRDTSTFDIEIDPDLIRPEDQSTRVGGVSYSFVLDSRPNPIDPAGGMYSILDAELATRVLGSNTNFATLFGRWFGYRSLTERLTLAVGARAGIKIPYGNSDTIPLPERFFAGGSTSLRGFALDRAGPVDDNGNPLGGRVLLIANVELRARIWGELGGVVFADIGNVFALPRTVRWKEVRETVGAGIRYATPVGPIRFDIARLLDRRDGEDTYQLFFSIGHTF
jgi:outer membrane protein assembly complex protein YaeT